MHFIDEWSGVNRTAFDCGTKTDSDFIHDFIFSNMLKIIKYAS